MIPSHVYAKDNLLVDSIIHIDDTNFTVEEENEFSMEPVTKTETDIGALACCSQWNWNTMWTHPAL